MSNGVDYAWSHPAPAALKTAGITFACRYLAVDETKALTAAEAKALAAAGIWSVVVWESTANRMLGGKAAGVADAKAAAAQATAAGQPAGRPIYFAADFDATEAQQTQINAYLDGVASVIGAARVGIYGGYYPVKRALDAGKATWAWQTIAWSGGQWDPRAHIRQGAQRTIGGVSCDLNTSMQADFGQWKPGIEPTPEVNPVTHDPLNAADDKSVWAIDNLIPAPKGIAAQPDAKTNPYYTPATHMQLQTQNAIEANLRVQELAADVAGLKAAVAALTDPAGFVAQVAAGLAALQITITPKD